MTAHPMCPAVSPSGLPCALLLDHASPGSGYPHITIEGFLFEEDAKPAIDEPEEFGSIVRASDDDINLRLWQRSPMHGKHYWESETGAVEVWSELTDVEVLRVGVGDDMDMTAEEFDRAVDAGTPTEVSVSLGRTYTKTINADTATAAYAKGVRDAKDKALAAMRFLREVAITAEKKDAYTKAIEAIGEVA